MYEVSTSKKYSKSIYPKVVNAFGNFIGANVKKPTKQIS